LLLGRGLHGVAFEVGGGRVAGEDVAVKTNYRNSKMKDKPAIRGCQKDQTPN
jgi:hypothetical protein